MISLLNLTRIPQELTFNLFKIAIILHILTSLWLDTVYQFEQECQYEDCHNSIDSYLNSFVMVTQIVTFNSSYQPKRQQEEACIIYIVISIVSLYLLAFILHSSKSIFSTNKETQELSQILDENKLSYTLKCKILSSIENKQQSHKNGQFLWENHKSLSDDLISEIIMSQRFKILQKYFNTYEEKSIINMVYACEEMTCHPNTTIITKGIQDDQSLYFIIDGSLDVLINGEKALLHRLRKGQVFGEISFISQCPRTATVKSCKSSQLLKLPLDSFLRILTQRDRQIYFSQRDSLLFDQKYPFSCFCCRVNTHHILECPVLKYRPSFNQIIDQEKELTQPRIKFHRKRQSEHLGALNLTKFFKENQEELFELYEENDISPQNFTIYPTLPYETTNPQFLSHNKIKMDRLRQDPKQKQDFEQEISQEYSSENPSEIEYLTNVKREIVQQQKYMTGRIEIGEQTLQELPSQEDECSILDCIKNKETEVKPTTMLQSDYLQSVPDSNKDQYNSNIYFNSSDSIRYHIQMMGRFPKRLSNFGRQYSSRNPIQSLSRIRSKSSKKSSSNFQPFQDQNIQEFNWSFEKMHFFEHFHPNYNYDTIITKMNLL